MNKPFVHGAKHPDLHLRSPKQMSSSKKAESRTVTARCILAVEPILRRIRHLDRRGLALTRLRRLSAGGEDAVALTQAGATALPAQRQPIHRTGPDSMRARSGALGCSDITRLVADQHADVGVEQVEDGHDRAGEEMLAFDR